MKEHLILVFYLNVDGFSKFSAQQYISNLMEISKKNFPENKYKLIFLPVKNQSTKVELLNPEIDEKSKEKLDKAIERIEDLYLSQSERRKRKLKKIIK
jgi:hypothetical protein